MPLDPRDEDDLLAGRPPRKRMSWRKLLLIGIGSFFLLLFGLDLLWSWLAHARLEAAIAAIRARGEPIDEKDFQPAQIPDSQNEAWYYQMAENAVSPINVKHWDWWTTAQTDDDVAELTATVEVNKAAFDWVAKARNYTDVAWPMPTIDPNNGNPSFKELNLHRELANALSLAAWVAEHDGQDDQALQCTADIIRLSDAVQQSFPCEIDNMVALGISALGTNSIPDLASRLNIVNTTAATRPTGATRQQVLQLIAVLNNERQYQQAAKRAFLGERRFILDHRDAAKNNAGHAAAGWLQSPVLDGDAAALLDYLGRQTKAFDQSNLPAALKALPDNPWLINASFLQTVFHPYAHKWAGSIDRYVETYFRGLMDRRAAAIFLAMYLWRADHPGQWPDSLAELVPAYLPAVPIDPFSPAGAEFAYKPNSPMGPIIYSVADDGVDDGGSEKSAYPNSTRMRDPSMWEMKDFVYHLIRPQPSTRPAALQ